MPESAQNEGAVESTTESAVENAAESAPPNSLLNPMEYSAQQEAPAPGENAERPPVWEADAAGAEESLSLRRIRRVLNESRDTAERRDAAQQLILHLWDRFPWQRYQAGCVLTTRVYLPASMYLLEWGSFPNVLARELRRNRHGLPASTDAQRETVSRTLNGMLSRWANRSVQNGAKKQSGGNINMDVAADVCEAVGRLGFVEAERDLLEIIRRFHSDHNQVRAAALLALAALPPEQLTTTWQWLQTGSAQEKRLIGAALAYMTLPQAVPFLLEAFPGVVGEAAWHQPLGMPLLLALGRIGDPRALPDLNRLARREGHPLQPTARKAIQRIMKEAEGHEEVTLVRASGASTLYEDVLLRASEEKPADTRPEQLLRAASEQDKDR